MSHGNGIVAIKRHSRTSMDQYCCLEDRHVPSGNFREFRLLSLSGLPYHEDEPLLNALALRIMERYESQPFDEPMELPAELIAAPNRTKHFYRRLFDQQKNPTQDFRTEASETLAEWVEERLFGARFTHRGTPHNNDPAFDVLSIFDEQDKLRLRVVQVKATQDQLQQNCNTTLTKFMRLEMGYYDPILNSHLHMIANHRSSPPGLKLRELLFGRHYRVAVIHGEERDGIEIMTTFEDKIRGVLDRRSGILMQVSWMDFWHNLGQRVYDQLS